MDIGAGHGWPSSALSNFAAHPFEIDAVACASMEGFLQALKFDKAHIQPLVCKLTGLAAKRAGSKRSKAWKRTQTLWWAGLAYDRHGDAYQDLLNRAYAALATNAGFQRALRATGSAVLTHAIGRRDPSETVLTRAEFCRRLTALRRALPPE